MTSPPPPIKVAVLLLELCITELEDVAASTDLSTSSASAVVQETPHPYPDDWDQTGSVRIPGAESLRVEFDRQSSTERRHDVLEIADGVGQVLATRSGREWSDWSSEIIVPGEEMRWRFSSDNSVNGWGWRFTVHPTMPPKAARSTLPDRVIQSKPSIDLVSCLLDFRLESAPGVDALPRLASALAACGRMQSLEPDQRIWALRRLRNLVSSTSVLEFMDMEALLRGEATITRNAVRLASRNSLQRKLRFLYYPSKVFAAALGSLIHVLPHMILKQYESEDATIRQGKQLMHTSFLRVSSSINANERHLKSFFQSLLSLAVDLNLDSLSCCRDQQKWSWFRTFAMAQRVSVALSKRTPLPKDFLNEVRMKLQGLMSLAEASLDFEHEDHELFKRRHDEQLMAWLQRHVAVRHETYRKFFIFFY